MDFESNVKSIKKVYSTLTGKGDVEVVLVYKGTSYGVTEPWHIKIDVREAKHKTHEGAAETLLTMLKEELKNKVLSTERDAAELRKALNSLEN